MKTIAKILALYFLLGSLLPGSDFSQLKAAAAIWEHFQLHQEIAARSGQKASLASFLAAHFWDINSHTHNDGGQSHQDLPLKSIHLFSQAPTSGISLHLDSPAAALSRVIAHYCFFAGAAHAVAIFRPPILS